MWDPPEHIICPRAWSQSPVENRTVNHVHPASCTHAVPCQKSRGGCRTRWQWSRPQNNWLSPRHPIIPCSHCVIPVFRCINVLLNCTKQNSCLHLLCINAAMKWDKKKRGLIAFQGCNVGRQIYLKCHWLMSKTLCWEERDYGFLFFFWVVPVNTGTW